MKKAKKRESQVPVRYLEEAAGIEAGAEKSLPLSLALQMHIKGKVEILTAKEVKPIAVKEEKAAPVTKELKTKPKTKGKK